MAKFMGKNLEISLESWKKILKTLKFEKNIWQTPWKSLFIQLPRVALAGIYTDGLTKFPKPSLNRTLE